jgi:hypothetical protein
MTASPEVEAALDALFGLPREEFVAARNSLARRLKDAGNRAAADRVKALRKPSLPAWSINQVARSRPEDVAALLEATERARAAALNGDGAGLRSATHARTALIAALTRAAGEALKAAGVTNTRSHLDPVRDALLAAASAEEADLLRSGRLTETLTGAGFESAFGGAESAILEAADDDAVQTQAVDLRARRLREQVAEADRRARRLEEVARAAEEEAGRARAAATAARAAAEALQRAEEASRSPPSNPRKR